MPESSKEDSDYTEDTESSLERVWTVRRSSQKKKPKPGRSMIELLQATSRSKTNSNSSPGPSPATDWMMSHQGLQESPGVKRARNLRSIESCVTAVTP